MTAAQLFDHIRVRKSFLCIGLDTDLKKMPAHLLHTEDPIFTFNKAIIDATLHTCVAYKLNTAFYEAAGIPGMLALQKTMAYIPATHFIIADAKRGDIGNTSDMYARAFFEAFKADAVTVAPYMGHDSISPFLQYPGKWAIVLGLTSNAGSADFQSLQTTNGQALYQQVIAKAATWGTPDNMMFVVGATHPDMFSKIREMVPHHFLLVPGVGAQGGDLKAVCRAGLNDTCGLLINNSRQVIYAGQGIDFANHAAVEAEKLQTEMEQILQQAGLLYTAYFNVARWQ